MKRFVLTLIFILFLGRFAYAGTRYNQLAQGQEKIFLNYNDLVQLSQTGTPQGDLFTKLQAQLYTPVVKQPPSSAGLLYEKNIGDYFKVAHWNIERGFNADQIEKILNNDLALLVSNDQKKEISALKDASVIILNEVDYGVPRTNYKNIAGILAMSLGYGYVFGTEFVEVDPYHLGVKQFTQEEKTFLEDAAVKQLENIQKDKYFGLHGTAILTKYPVISTRIIRLPDCYGWFKEEQSKLSSIEVVRRDAAHKIFTTKILTELRHGSRMAIVADLLLPNNDVVTIVATHLENRCVPECRVKQFQYILNKISTVRNPVILAGDLNTTGTDASPVIIKKEILKRVKDPEFIAKQAILAFTPISFVENIVAGTINQIRQFRNPTKQNIPIILPNKEAKLFELLKEFRFNDGEKFDVAGDTERAYRNKRGFLSDSNERVLKGFKETFEIPRTLGVGQYKLDWIFVKPEKEKYLPYFGRTLKLANNIPGKNHEHISDHYPVIVDIVIRDQKSALQVSSQ